MAFGGNESRPSSNFLMSENDEKVESNFDDARDEPDSMIPTPITSSSRLEMQIPGQTRALYS